MSRLDVLGQAIDARIALLEAHVSGVRAVALGIFLAAAVTAGGLAAFLVVLAVLVELFA